VFHPGYQGRGLATEAAEVVLGLGFDGLGLHRVIGRCDALNLPSARLMERLGMRREAHFVHNEIFKGSWGDELVYALLEDEWRGGSAAAGRGEAAPSRTWQAPAASSTCLPSTGPSSPTLGRPPPGRRSQAVGSSGRRDRQRPDHQRRTSCSAPGAGSAPTAGSWPWWP
jgi:hypothetical protein